MPLVVPLICSVAKGSGSPFSSSVLPVMTWAEADNRTIDVSVNRSERIVSLGVLVCKML